MGIRIGMAAALIVATAGAVWAQQSQILFSHKSWQVEVWALTDGSFACEAKVSAPGDSFSIWTYPTGDVQVEFYSSAWQFGEGQSAELQMQIDGRVPWTQSGATLSQNSVLFYLPDDAAGIDFIVEVARGNRLYLRDADGNDVKDYSLAGSRASIDALIECGTAIGR